MLYTVSNPSPLCYSLAPSVFFIVFMCVALNPIMYGRIDDGLLFFWDTLHTFGFASVCVKERVGFFKIARGRTARVHISWTRAPISFFLFCIFNVWRWYSPCGYQFGSVGCNDYREMFVSNISSPVWWCQSLFFCSRLRVIENSLVGLSFSMETTPPPTYKLTFPSFFSFLNRWTHEMKPTHWGEEEIK